MDKYPLINWHRKNVWSNLFLYYWKGEQEIQRKDCLLTLKPNKYSFSFSVFDEFRWVLLFLAQALMPCVVQLELAFCVWVHHLCLCVSFTALELFANTFFSANKHEQQADCMIFSLNVTKKSIWIQQIKWWSLSDWIWWSNDPDTEFGAWWKHQSWPSYNQSPLVCVLGT